MTDAGLGAGGRKIVPLGIQRGSNRLDTLESSVEVGNDLVATGKDHHLLGTEGDRRGTVADHVEIDQLTVGSDGIGTGQEEIGQERLAATFDDLPSFGLRIEGHDHGDPRSLHQFIEHPGLLHRH